ncbi:unnamed protein product [Symbiodinium pilosum]|uniref:SH3 domain-containing protein n=1 Tax=Symbiodinium pilosum TaxID=2952 RepID=A0A812W8F6_SYMPI|nr:unnamed protein product [Symbiodinium pilosum]
MAAARRRGVMKKDDLLEAMEEAATDVPDSPQRPELPGALSAVAAAAEAEGALGAQAAAKPEAGPTTQPAAPKKQGIPYEVVYDAVWVRREPNSKGDRLTKRVKGDRLRIFGFDDTQNWGRVQVKVREGEVEGWVMLQHDELGDLIRTCEDEEMGP